MLWSALVLAVAHSLTVVEIGPNDTLDLWNTPGDCPSPNSMNVPCASLHCPLSMAEAFADPVFSGKLMPCMKTCNCLYYNSVDPQRLDFINCTTKCAFSYQSDPGQKFLQCAMQAQCMTFAPINVTCPKPKMKAGTGLHVFEGKLWRQQWGWNRLFDAYPCQQIHNMSLVNDATFCAQTKKPDGTPIKAPCWHYDYSYEVFTETGLFHERQIWQLPGDGAPGQPVEIFYSYAGSLHNETWWIIDANDHYVLLYDCSEMSGWNVASSIVWVRADYGPLTVSDKTAISTAYTQAGFPASTGGQGWLYPQDFLEDQWQSGCGVP